MIPFLLPVQGLIYVAQHRVSPAGIARRAAMLTAGSTIAVIALYTKGWAVQSNALSHITGTGFGNWVATHTLLASESSLALYLVFKRLIKEQSVFNAVLARRGQTVAPFSEGELSALKASMQRKEAQRQLHRQQQGAAEKLLRYAMRQVGQRLVTAPLLLVPGVGLAAWLYANAKSEGAKYYDDYFERKGLKDPRMRAALVDSRQTDFMMFGTTVLLFNMVPVLSSFLSFGNAAGAALWAADMEENKSSWVGDLSPQQN